jgi:hypothetical protein
MNRKGVSEPSQETSPLLTADDRLHVASYTENPGGSAIDGAALHRNEQDGEIAWFTKLWTYFE